MYTMLFAATRVAILLLIISTSLWVRLSSLSRVPPVLLQKELKIGLAAQVLNDSKINEVVALFYGDFGFINTQFIAPFSILFTAPFVKAFGLTPQAIRFPSVLAGIAAIVLFYFLAREAYTIIIKNTKPVKRGEFFPLIATFVFAFSSWHIQVSRIDTGVNLGLFFFLLGHYISLKFSKNTVLFFFLIPAFVAAMYSDYLFFIPATLCIAIIFFTRLKHFFSLQVVSALLLTAFLLTPILTRIYAYHIHIDRINSERLVFNAEKTSNRAEKTGNTLKSKILNDPYIENTKLYLRNITDYLEPASIFVKWSYNTGYISPYIGLLHPLELIFLIAGSIFLLKNGRNILRIFVIFVASLVLPQAVQVSNPDAIRMIPVLIPVTLVIPLGFFYIWDTVFYNSRKVFFIGVIILFSYFLGRFNYFFFTHSGIPVPDYYLDYQKAFEFTDKTAKPDQKIIVIDATYGQDLSLYWLFLTKRENLAKKYVSQNSTTTFDNYTFLPEVPKKYKRSTLYIQPFVTVPKYFPAVFLSTSSDKKFQISVFLTPKK